MRIPSIDGCLRLADGRFAVARLGYDGRMSRWYFVLTAVLLPLFVVVAAGFAVADALRGGVAAALAALLAGIAGLALGAAFVRARGGQPLGSPRWRGGLGAGAAGGAVAGLVDGLPAAVRAACWAFCAASLLCSFAELLVRRRVGGLPA
jgi:hypothetical protein